jgi:hypothetical protein
MRKIRLRARPTSGWRRLKRYVRASAPRTVLLGKFRPKVHNAPYPKGDAR